MDIGYALDKQEIYDLVDENNICYFKFFEDGRIMNTLTELHLSVD